MGSLIPNEGKDPQFAQLYIFDTQNELSNRVNAVQPDVDESDAVDNNIVKLLIAMFDEVNPIVKTFRMAKDKMDNGETETLRIRLKANRRTDGRQYNLPTASEIAGLIVGDFSADLSSRDLIIQSHDNNLQHVSEIHPLLMALQYPLLFPHGEDGYHPDIPLVMLDPTKSYARKTVSMKEFYAYGFMHRYDSNPALLCGGRLLQQYGVDAYSCIERERLLWIRLYQEKLRMDILSGIEDSYSRGDTMGSQFVGNMDFPHLFLTFTCNSKWSEITEAFKDTVDTNAEDKPDIVSRIFWMKLRALRDDIKKKKNLWKSYMHVIEFQKRGLPHAHMVIWLGKEFQSNMPHIVDCIVTAEIPDPKKDRQGYDVVCHFMIHGSCGLSAPSAPCMVKGKCSKGFPKDYCNSTATDHNGMFLYRRRNTKVHSPKGIILDNRYVVSFNQDLVVKYQAHINIQICTHGKLMKYLFKYLHKGPDRAKVIIERNKKNGNSSRPINNESGMTHNLSDVVDCISKPKDEIQAYLDCRYLSAYEAFWRIFEFPIHERNPAIQRLIMHLPGKNNVTVRDNQPLSTIVNNPRSKITHLTAWMEANAKYPEARKLTYQEFPT
ncbi:uncharacterized protein [Rutidosis leptorrhynchoides]|uniref:uncharacterized protein n=1 Tax=Rutidosis leptorrhynchoides TaxID=125765 RepID=UPI003A9930E8